MTATETEYVRRLEESHRGLFERVRHLERHDAALRLALRAIIVQGHLDQLVEMIATAQRSLHAAEGDGTLVVPWDSTLGQGEWG